MDGYIHPKTCIWDVWTCTLYVWTCIFMARALQPAVVYVPAAGAFSFLKKHAPGIWSMYFVDFVICLSILSTPDICSPNMADLIK